MEKENGMKPNPKVEVRTDHQCRWWPPFLGSPGTTFLDTLGMTTIEVGAGWFCSRPAEAEALWARTWKKCAQFQSKSLVFFCRKIAFFMVFVGASKRFFLTFEMVKECIFLFDENSTFFEIFTHCGPRHQRPQKCRPPRPSAEIMANRFGCWRPMPTKSLLILHYYHFFSKSPQPLCYYCYEGL